MCYFGRHAIQISYADLCQVEDNMKNRVCHAAVVAVNRYTELVSMGRAPPQRRWFCGCYLWCVFVENAKQADHCPEPDECIAQTVKQRLSPRYGIFFIIDPNDETRQNGVLKNGDIRGYSNPRRPGQPRDFEPPYIGLGWPGRRYIMRPRDNSMSKIFYQGTRLPYATMVRKTATGAAEDVWAPDGVIADMFRE